MDIFTKFKSTIKLRPVRRDNEVFQLHYRVTAVLLAASGLMIASKQHFGDPIDCITKDDVPEKLMETYCWIQGTFTMPSVCNSTYGDEIPHPCIDTFVERSYDRDSEKERVYHAYYQWVYFVLFFQAGLFYLPNIVWKSCESKLLSKLTTDVHDPISKDDKKRKEHIDKLVEYFMRRRNREYVESNSKLRYTDKWRYHSSYFAFFICCETANLVNVLMQFVLVHHFLGGTFYDYGWNSMSRIFSNKEQNIDPDPMEVVFPKMTKCTFRRFGPSGDVVKYDALCILPLNILNEKIYLVMWFWFIALGFITFVWLIYRAMTIRSEKFRVWVIERRLRGFNDDTVISTLSRMGLGDWFLLSMMCKNIDHFNFRTMLVDLATKLDDERTSERAEMANIVIKKNDDSHT